MKKLIAIRSSFGHEIMALNFAKALNMDVVILPKKEQPQEFDYESNRIFNSLSFMTKNLVRISFNEKEQYETQSWDIVQDLQEKKIPDQLWNKFAETRLIPQEDTNTLPQYGLLNGKKNILFVPQKLLSDGSFGVSAQEQSLSLDKFNFLKQRNLNLVLGQHFNKEKDLAAVQSLAKEFSLYVPGMNENSEVFGIRGVAHKLYYNMYTQLSGSIGIAGTHTWLMLTMFPEIPQIILYNKIGLENWTAITAAFRAAGRKIWAVPFSTETDRDNDVEKSFANIEAFF